MGIGRATRRRHKKPDTIARQATSLSYTVARPPRWRETRVDAGYAEVRLTRWQSLYEYIDQELLQYRDYVFRGQGDSEWDLVSSIDRQLPQNLDPLVTLSLYERQLEAFKRSCRGGLSELDLDRDEENEWWALGQHMGLWTPLLDWTESPFVAAYFALADDRVRLGENGCRAVWALAKTAVANSAMQFVEPRKAVNQRIIVQRALFTRTTSPGKCIKELVQEENEGDSNYLRLIKFLLPESATTKGLVALNRMNINHRSLFPDAYGAAKFANRCLVTPFY